MKRIIIPVTTDADGDGTGYGSESVNGLVYAVQKVDGDLADGVDLTLTCETDELSIPVLVHADFNTDGMAYPRVLESLNTDGTALSTHCMPVAFGRPKAVLAAGGDTKTGSFVLYVLDI